jgi:ribonuclease HI
MESDELKKVTIYTSGACLGNPGPGGYAVVLEYNKYKKELSGGYKRTTNNRMELMAAIAGLRALKRRCRVTLWSNSESLVHTINEGWVRDWKRQDGKLPNKKRIADIDLWSELSELSEKNFVKFECNKDYPNGGPNARCEKMANRAARDYKLMEDVGYRQKKALETRAEERSPGAATCPICSGSGHIMVKAGPRSHKATKKIMCSTCIGNGYLKEKITD